MTEHEEAVLRQHSNEAESEGAPPSPTQATPTSSPLLKSQECADISTKDTIYERRFDNPIYGDQLSPKSPPRASRAGPEATGEGEASADYDTLMDVPLTSEQGSGKNEGGPKVGPAVFSSNPLTSASIYEIKEED